MQANHHPRKILVLTSASTGNNVFCTPAIQLLHKHRPQDVIEVVVLNDLSAEVFAGNTAISRVHVIKKSKQFDQLAQGFDMVLALNKNALKKLPDIKVPYKLAPSLIGSKHHADQLLEFVAEQINVKVVDEDRCYFLPVLPSACNLIVDQVSTQDTVINIHLGCGTTLLHGWKFFYSRRADDKKLWSIESYIELGQRLQASIPHLKIVITGTSNESFLAKKFEKQVGNTINLVGKTTVSDLVLLLQRANLFISHDCGVFHIAAATNVPMIGLFGPTNHLLTGPYPANRACQLIKKEKMSDILASEVVEAAKQMLAK